MKRAILFLLIIIILAIAWFGESRKFFCLDNGKCITVWKTYNDVCYIVPGKYYGLLKPSNNFIETSNLNEQLTIFFTDELPNTLIVQSQQELEVHNKNGFAFLDYNADSASLKQILYKPNAALFYKDLKPTANLIDIDIKENYARGKDGKIF